MPKKYQWILFDADDTLFTFNASSGLERMFAHYNIEFSLQDYRDFQLVNQALWVDYQKGTITATQLQHQRFQSWAKKLQIPAMTLNSAFLTAMAEICTPLAGAVSLLDCLRSQGGIKLGIITNGFTELQEIRLQRTGLRDRFEILVISEQVGFAKPHSKIFEHALEKMGNPPPECVLMVGDNFDADVLGGMSAGLDTCWLNTHHKPLPTGRVPTYQISALLELEALLTILPPAEAIQVMTPKEEVVAEE
jgi:5'-nucleotidase